MGQPGKNRWSKHLKTNYSGIMGKQMGQQMGTIMGEWRWEKDGSKDGGDMGKLRSFADAETI